MSDFIFVYQNLLESPITSEYNVDLMSLTRKGLAKDAEHTERREQEIRSGEKTKVMVTGRMEELMVVTLNDIKLFILQNRLRVPTLREGPESDGLMTFGMDGIKSWHDASCIT